MAVALALQYIDVTRRRIKRNYKLTFSGSYVTNGDTIDFTGASNPNHLEGALPGSRVPTGYNVENSPGAYKFEVVPGTTLKNWKIKIIDNTNAGAELAASSYPAAISGATTIRLSTDSKVNGV